MPRLEEAIESLKRAPKGGSEDTKNVRALIAAIEKIELDVDIPESKDYSQAIADLGQTMLDALQRNSEAIAAAVKNVSVNVEAPTVNVEAPSVEVTPQVVVEAPAFEGFKLRVNQRDGNDRILELEILKPGSGEPEPPKPSGTFK